MSFNKDALLHKLQDENEKYKQAYNILMDYWDVVYTDEEQKYIHKQLKEFGL